MLKRWAAWPQGIRLLAGIAVVVLALAIVWVLFVPVADWLAHHDAGSVKGALHETAVDNARGRLLTLGAGLFAAGALVFTALNFKLLQRNSEQADQWQRRTYELTEQGQVTDRYTKAIEQLGSEKADVRIGGIYALERIARDSEKDHPAVMEVLTAFIREQRPSLDHAASGEQERSTWPDVQAAVTVVGRRDAKRDIRRIDLTRADLTGMTFRGAALNGAILNGATLRGADLGAAHLNGATFRGADLTDALLWTAHLNSANLADANLTGAIVVGTDLTDAVLTGADLTGTVPWRARFTPAHSRRVTLTDDGPRTLLLMLPAKLTGAWWPADTPVPGGWKLARGRLVGARTDSGPTEAS